jgi:hypothetical protein
MARKARTASTNGHQSGQSNGDGYTANRLEEMFKGLPASERIKRLVEIAEGRKIPEQVQVELEAEAVQPPPLNTVGNGEPSSGGRNPQSGRFAPGNKCARGNPHHRRQAELRRIMTEAAAPHLEKIALRLTAKAACGDVQAAALLLSYVLGKPRLCPDPDQLDG